MTKSSIMRRALVLPAVAALAVAGLAGVASPASAAPSAAAAQSASAYCLGYPTDDLGWLHYNQNISANDLSWMFAMPLQEVHARLLTYSLNCR
ncbi:hypothetical protein Asp14428_59470 [Actinoplanes sp. NBRC 14428]|nr:hypothetical protein Asp14428_59470 [Actinoplanes sp. NBRC 14428]